MAPSKSSTSVSAGAGPSAASLAAAAAFPSSVYPRDSIKDVADQVGITNLGEDVAAALATDVEYRLHEIAEEAIKFMRHARRTKLTTEDIDLALRVRNVEPLYGFHPHSSKSSVNPTFRKAPSSTAGAAPIHYVEDEEIDFDKVLDAGPKTSVEGPKAGVSWSAHWLALEGIQPAIPQNPSPAPASSRRQFSGPTRPSTEGTASSAASGGGVSVRPLVKHVLSRELQLYFERLTFSILAPPSAVVEEERAEGENEMEVDGADVSREPGRDRVREAALASLRGDPGLHQLVPYLVQWCGEKVRGSLHDLNTLEAALSAIHALLDNPHLFVEPYLHQLMPALLTVLLTSTLGPSVPPTSYPPSAPTPTSLRIHAASLVSHVLSAFSSAYPSLRPRVTRTLLKALRDGGPATEVQGKPAGTATAGTRLGAVIGLRKLGREGGARMLLSGDALRKLEEWAETVEGRTREAILGEMVEEVKLGLASLSEADGERLAVPLDTDARASLESSFGSFWLDRLEAAAEAGDVDARRAIGSMLESARPGSVRSEDARLDQADEMQVQEGI